VVTTHTFDIANRLTARQVSDGPGVGFGRTYTYTWAARGLLLTEHALSGGGATQSYPVRTFSHDGAG